MRRFIGFAASVRGGFPVARGAGPGAAERLPGRRGDTGPWCANTRRPSRRPPAAYAAAKTEDQRRRPQSRKPDHGVIRPPVPGPRPGGAGRPRLVRRPLLGPRARSPGPGRRPGAGAPGGRPPGRPAARPHPPASRVRRSLRPRRRCSATALEKSPRTARSRPTPATALMRCWSPASTAPPPPRRVGTAEGPGNPSPPTMPAGRRRSDEIELLYGRLARRISGESKPSRKTQGDLRRDCPGRAGKHEGRAASRRRGRHSSPRGRRPRGRHGGPRDRRVWTPAAARCG